MRKIILSLFALLIFFAFPTHKALAEHTLSVSPTTVPYGDKINITVSNLFTNDPATFYNINITYRDGTFIEQMVVDSGCNPGSPPNSSWTIISCSGKVFNATFDPTQISSTVEPDVDAPFTVTAVSPKDSAVSQDFTVLASNPPPPGTTFKIDSVTPGSIDNPAHGGDTITIALSNITVTGSYGWQLAAGLIGDGACNNGSTGSPSTCSISFHLDDGLEAGTYNLVVVSPNPNRKTQSISFELSTPDQCLKCFQKDCIKTNARGKPYCLKNCKESGGKTPPENKTPKCNDDETCIQGKGCEARFPEEPDPFFPLPCKEGRINVENCVKIDTALGEIRTSPGGFIKDLLSILLSLSGGIAVILIIISGYKLMVSRGNPEQVQNAREQLTAAIVGLLFIIFSLVLLEVIGKNILGLPGFGG